MKRYVFEQKLIERIDASNEEDARLELPDAGFDWDLIDVTDIPENQRVPTQAEHDGIATFVP